MPAARPALPARVDGRSCCLKFSATDHLYSVITATTTSQPPIQTSHHRPCYLPTPPSSSSSSFSFYPRARSSRAHGGILLLSQQVNLATPLGLGSAQGHAARRHPRSARFGSPHPIPNLYSPSTTVPNFSPSEPHPPSIASSPARVSSRNPLVSLSELLLPRPQSPQTPNVDG